MMGNRRISGALLAIVAGVGCEAMPGVAAQRDQAGRWQVEQTGDAIRDGASDGHTWEPTASAKEAWCTGLYVAHVVAETTNVAFLSPDCMIQATEGWGPQLLGITVNHGIAPQVTYESSPSLSKQKNDITRSVQSAVGWNVTASVDLSASTAVLVPANAYYRLEAYPEYQVTRWDLRADACGLAPDVLITSGVAYRPVGVQFRVMVFVSGAWNAVNPPGPTEVMTPPPWSRAGAADGGAPGG